MITYHADIAIARPAADVFPFLADVTQHPSWMGGSRAVPISDGAMRPGYRYRYTTDEGDLEIEVTDFQPGRRFGARTISGPMTWAGTFEVVADGESGTRVVSTGSVALSGLRRLLEPFAGGEVQKREREELERLKVLVETR